MKTCTSVRSISRCNTLLLPVLFLFIGLLSPTNAQPPHTVQWEADVSRAVSLAQETNRLLFIHFHGNNCPPCKAMDENVFVDPRVIAKLNNHFVSVKADVAHNAPLAKQLDIVAIPTNIVLNAKGQMVNRRQGGITPDRFLEYLDYLQSLAPPPQNVAAQEVAAAVEAVQQNPNALLDPFTKKPVAPASPTPVPPAPVVPAPVAPVTASPAVPVPVSPSPASPPVSPPPAPPVPVVVAAPAVPSAPADPFALVQTAPASAAPVPTPPTPAVIAAPVPAPPIPAVANAPVSVPAAIVPPNTPSVPMPNPASVQVSAPPMPQPAVIPKPTEATAGTAPKNNPVKIAETVAIANDSPTTAPNIGQETPVLTVEVPLGLEGYCPVVLGLEERWIPGNPAFYAMYRGQIYRFSNQAALDQFQGNPLKFSPVAMGDDVVLMVDRNKKANGTRKFGAWYEGRVYLFSCQETLSAFAANPEYYADIAQKYETAFKTSTDAVQR